MNKPKKESYIWIGRVTDSGNVRAKRVGYFEGTEKYGETPTHAMMGMYRGKRWRCPEDSRIVFWWESPEPKEAEMVEEWLASKGVKVKRQIANVPYDDESFEAMEDNDTIYDLAHGHRELSDFKKDREKAALNRFLKKYDLRSRQLATTSESVKSFCGLFESERLPSGPLQTFKDGEVLWFEYHCDESDSSKDAHLRDRSHQKVTVVKMVKDSDGWVLKVPTMRERAEDGCPIAYEVKFSDGLVGTVMEDELFYDRSSWNRPDPPNNRNQSGEWEWNGFKMVPVEK